MDLIQHVKIEGLRSIQEQMLSGASSLNSFVGKNSSGKSNALRALNLFFNGSVEPGKTLDFSRDHFERLPRVRKRKRIAIEVEFALPNNFKLRNGLEALKALGDRFTIIRAWELDPVRRPVENIEVRVGGTLIENGEELASQFLSLITYRYIPNRTVPSAILRDESQAIANSIFGRMKGDQHADALLSALSEAAERMLSDASESMTNIGSPLKSPSVSTAESIGEMLTMGGFQAKGAHGLTVQDEDWGAGHQAFFLYQVLKTLDTTYSRFFGWKQATIWGVEEPEAALHRDLETRLAYQFRRWCMEEGTKMQIFLTTHSPIFTMAAETGFWAELEDGATKFQRLPIPELTRAAETRGVGGWVHPILYFPWNPVVLAEGPIDAEVLTHVARLAGVEHLRFVSLPQLDSEERRGGKDKIVTFLKNSHGLIQNRSKEAPLIVLLDWEVSKNDLDKARKEYGPGGERFVQLMNASHCDTLMGTDFKGIERFYPPEVLMDAHDAGELVMGISNGKPYSVSHDQLIAAKNALRKRVLAIKSLDRLATLAQVVIEVDGIFRQQTHAQLTLPGLAGAKSEHRQKRAHEKELESCSQPDRKRNSADVKKPALKPMVSNLATVKISGSSTLPKLFVALVHLSMVGQVSANGAELTRAINEYALGGEKPLESTNVSRLLRSRLAREQDWLAVEKIGNLFRFSLAPEWRASWADIFGNEAPR